MKYEDMDHMTDQELKVMDAWADSVRNTRAFKLMEEIQQSHDQAYWDALAE